jgi:hypothetical protein
MTLPIYAVFESTRGVFYVVCREHNVAHSLKREEAEALAAALNKEAK